jgi:hypothetical protein
MQNGSGLFKLFILIGFLTGGILFDIPYARAETVKAKSGIEEIREDMTGKYNIRDTSAQCLIITLEDLECKYIDPEKLDLTKEINFDSTLPACEILLPTSPVSFENKVTYIVAQLIRNDEFVILRAKLEQDQYIYYETPDQDLYKLTDSLNYNEILLSIYYNYYSTISSDYEHYNTIRNGSRGSGEHIRFQEISEKIIKDMSDDHPYKIYIRSKSENSVTVFEVKGKNLKEVFEYNFIKKTRGGKKPTYFGLIKSLSYNDDIPYELKKDALLEYNAYYFDVFNTEKPSKDRYFDFLCKLITDYPSKPLPLNGLTDCMDQYAVISAIQKYCFEQAISGTDLLAFSQRVLEISENPGVILQAYSAMTKYYLDTGDLIQAQTIAIEALEKYDTPISGKEELLNALPAVTCIVYMFETGMEPEKIYSLIDVFDSHALLFPEFQNFLQYMRAMVTGMSANPLEDVIAAYAKVITESKTKYNFQGIGENDRVTFDIQDARKAIKQLEQEKEEKITVEGAVKVKKYLFSKKTQIINESETMDVVILQKTPLELERRLDYRMCNGWQKAEINREIYWVYCE